MHVYSNIWWREVEVLWEGSCCGGGGSVAAGRACLGLSRILTKLLHNINRIVLTVDLFFVHRHR